MCVNKANIWISTGLFLILLYPYSISISNVLFQYQIVKGFILLIGFVCLNFPLLKHANNLRIGKSILINLILTLFILINNHNYFNTQIVSDLLFVLLLFESSLFLGRNKEWIMSYNRIIGAFSVFYSLCTVVFWLYPIIYFDYAIKLLPPDYYGTLLYFYNNGYMAGLTQHYSINGIYTSIGTLYFGSLCLCKTSRTKSNMLLFALCFFALVLTAKRAHLLFSLVSLILTKIADSKSIKEGVKSIVISLVVIFMFIVTLYMLSDYIPVVSRFVNIIDSGVTERFEMYKLAYDMFVESPVIGNGWCSYRYYYSSLHSSDFFSLLDTHNIYIQMLAEIGVLGTFSFLLFLYRNLLHAYKCLKIYNNLHFKCFVLISISLQIFFLIYGLTGNPLYDCQMFIPYLFCISMTEYYFNNKCIKSNINNNNALV